MKYLLMRNDNWEYATDGTPVGVVDDITMWTQFQNISIYKINTDGTIGKQIKKYGIGLYWTDGQFVYKETEERSIYIGDLSKDIEKFFQTEN